jgi:hypothetical protein
MRMLGDTAHPRREIKRVRLSHGPEAAFLVKEIFRVHLNLRDFCGHGNAPSSYGLLPDIFCLVAIRFRQLDYLRCSLLLLSKP